MSYQTLNMICSDARHRSPFGDPQGTFRVSAYFRCAFQGLSDVQVTPSLTVVPLNRSLVSQGGGWLDLTSFSYVIPFSGPYHFDFSVLLKNTGSVNNKPVTLALEVGRKGVIAPTVQMVCCNAHFTGVRDEMQSVSGSATLELDAEQTVRLTLSSESGNEATFISSSDDLPMSSFLSGYSLF